MRLVKAKVGLEINRVLMVGGNGCSGNGNSSSNDNGTRWQRHRWEEEAEAANALLQHSITRYVRASVRTICIALQ